MKCLVCGIARDGESAFCGHCGAPPVRAQLGDITKTADVDAIVNAANRILLGGGGVDGAIHKAAGSGLRKECLRLHGCRTGQAKLTGGYNLPCKYVIHTVGPVWHGGKNGEDRLLADCYRNSLLVAVGHGVRRIAFPSISTGVYHYPVDKAAGVAIAEVREFIKSHQGALDLIEWILFDEDTHRAYDALLRGCEVGA